MGSAWVLPNIKVSINGKEVTNSDPLTFVGWLWPGY